MPVLLLRHVDAGSRAAWAGDDRHRPASPHGLAQATALAALHQQHGVVAVWSSPYRRCVDSVTPLATAAGTEVEAVDDLAEGTPPDRVGRLLHRAASVAEERGGAVLLCSHGDVIGGVVEGLVYAGRVARTQARWPKAGAWVLSGLPDDPRAEHLPPPATPEAG